MYHTLHLVLRRKIKRELISRSSWTRSSDFSPSADSFAVSCFFRSSLSSRSVRPLFRTRARAMSHTRGFASRTYTSYVQRALYPINRRAQRADSRTTLPRWRFPSTKGNGNDNDDDDGERRTFFAKSAPLTVQGQPAGSLRAALLLVGYSQGLGGGSYSFLLSFRARAFFIPLTFLNALLILSWVARPPRGGGSPTNAFIAN